MSHLARAQLVVLVVAIGVAVPSPATGAASFSVTSTSDATDAVAGNGTCETAPGNGVCTLRAAIQETNALPGADTVKVPAGHYNLTIAGANEDAAASGDLDVLDNLTLTGAGAPSTVIDGGAADRILDIAPAGFADPVAQIEVGVSGVTIRNGMAFSGGGVRYARKLTLTESVVRDNSSTSNGGGLASTNLIFDDPRLELVDSLVTGNRAAATIGGDGGGIDATFSTSLTVTRSEISDNTATVGGGIAASVVAEPVVLTEVTISDNTIVPGGLGIGGGLIGGCMTIVRSTFSGNTSRTNGGGLQNGGECGASITNSTFSGNSSGTRGGGIANSGSLALTNVTITDGSGAVDGGGIFQFGMGSSTTLLNTIVAGNAGGDCSGVAITSSGRNIGSDATCNFTHPTDRISTDPLLGPLADNGGPTLTHALLDGSPAIDAAAYAGLTTDQRGVARPQGADFDVGAFELEPPTITVQIDVKPCSNVNPIKVRSHGVITVAILTTPAFDAVTVDPLSVAFGPAGAHEAHGRGHTDDVDADGDLDLVLHFRTQETGLTVDDTKACLTGVTFAATPIKGCDTVTTE